MINKCSTFLENKIQMHIFKYLSEYTQSSQGALSNGIMLSLLKGQRSKCKVFFKYTLLPSTGCNRFLVVVKDKCLSIDVMHISIS